MTDVCPHVGTCLLEHDFGALGAAVDIEVPAGCTHLELEIAIPGYAGVKKNYIWFKLLCFPVCLCVGVPGSFRERTGTANKTKTHNAEVSG